jgi:hypothetical protein
MTSSNQSEVWLRGSLPGIPPVLQPVGHALLQAREDAVRIMYKFPDDLLWEKPAGLASPGFHLLHLSGVIDRLITYARGEKLNSEQLNYLHQEENGHQTGYQVSDLLTRFEYQVDFAIKELEKIPEGHVLESRTVGRAQIPSTTLGLLVHCAEHTQRHIGQLLVTARILAVR